MRNTSLIESFQRFCSAECECVVRSDGERDIFSPRVRSLNGSRSYEFLCTTSGRGTLLIYRSLALSRSIRGVAGRPFIQRLLSCLQILQQFRGYFTPGFLRRHLRKDIYQNLIHAQFISVSRSVRNFAGCVVVDRRMMTGGRGQRISRKPVFPRWHGIDQRL